MKESISHLALFNHINHSNPTLFVDLRQEGTFKTCHLRNAHLVKLEQCKAGGLLTALSHVSKRNSYMLIFVTDGSVNEEIFRHMFMEIEEFVSAAEKAEAKKEASLTLTWSNFSTVEHVAFPSFFEAYPACTSLYEGENYPSTKRIFKHYSSEIVSGFMYLGSFYDATDEVIMSDMRITHVVDATSEHMSQALAEKLNLTYLHIPVWDMEGVDITHHFSTVLEFVQAARAAQGKVLIHCRAGISRSSTLVMVCLMTHGQVKSLQEAVHHVVTQRPYVLPNPSFREQLRAYEETLFGTSSFSTDAEMLAFISSINFCWSGIFSAETDFDCIPIIAASKQLNAIRLPDMFPTDDEKEKNEMKPKKPFLMRGPRRPVANSQASSTEPSATCKARECPEPSLKPKEVSSKKVESLRDVIRARKAEAAQISATNAFVPILIPGGEVPVVDTANPTAGTGITAVRALKSPATGRKALPSGDASAVSGAEVCTEVNAPAVEVPPGELVHAVVCKVIGSEATPPVPPFDAEEGMLLRDWRNGSESAVELLPTSPSKSLRT